MQRRLLKASLAALIGLGITTSASAQWRPSGDLTGFLLVERGGEEPRVGGGLLVDLYERFGALRLGFGLGMAASTSDNDNVNRIFAPVGAYVGVGSTDSRIGLHAHLRGGFWAGATNIGLRAGPWLGGGAMMDVALDGSLRLGLGFEYWMFFGDGPRRDMFTPTISLRWSPVEL